MDSDQVVKILVSVVPVLLTVVTTVVTTATSRDRRRRQMHADAELVEKLPDSSMAQKAVLELIDANARSLLEQRTYEIDKYGLSLGIVGSIGLGYLSFWLWTQGTWWSWLAFAVTATFWLAFFLAIFEAAQKKDRVAIAAEKARAKAEKEAAKTASAAP